MNLAVVEKTKIQPRFWNGLNVEVEVFLEPWNENHELNYMENFKGTAVEILKRAREIVNGLSNVLVQGEFRVRVEDQNLTQSFFVDSTYIYDENWNRLFEIDEILENALYRQ